MRRRFKAFVAPAPSPFFIGVFGALAGLIGLDIGVISGALKFIQHDFQVGDGTLEWVVSSMMGGAAVGAVIASRLSAALGASDP